MITSEVQKSPAASILVADDNWPDLKSSLDVWLKDYTLIFEERGDRILSILSQRPEIGVVLLDLGFSNQPMQGPEVAHAIHKLHPQIQVIILSARSDVDLALRLRDGGVIRHYIEKDKFERDTVVPHVRRAIDFYEYKQKSEALSLMLIDSQSRASIGDISLSLTNMQYALYRTTAQAVLEKWPGVGPAGFGGNGWLAFPDLFDPKTKAAQVFLTIYEASYRHAISRPDRLREYMEEAADPKRLKGYREGRCDQIRKIISPCRSHINKELERAASDPLLINKFKIHQKSRRMHGKPVSTFGLTLDPTRIIMHP